MFSGIITTNFASLFMLACVIVLSVSIVSTIIFACGRQDNQKQNSKIRGKQNLRDHRLPGDGGGGCRGGGGCGGGGGGGG